MLIALAALTCQGLLELKGIFRKPGQQLAHTTTAACDRAFCLFCPCICGY